jgi:hypothetical protein
MSVFPGSGGPITPYLKPQVHSYLQNLYIPAFDVSVEQTAYNTADTISVKSIVSIATTDFGLLSQQNSSPIPMRVLVGAPGDPNSYNNSVFDQLIYGFLDELDTDYDTDELEFRGRGALALLVDARTTQRVDMNVDVGIAIAKLISSVGLTPKVQPAGVLVGKILGSDFVSIGRNLKILEFIQKLANGIGWITRCQGTTVIVGPPPSPAQVPVFTKTWSAGGALTARVKHSALHAHDIKVKVISYLPKSKGRVVTQGTQDLTDLLSGQTLQLPTAGGTLKTPVTGGRQSGFATGNFQFSRAEEYVFQIPGLTSAQADARAAKIQAELSRHEFILDMSFTPTPEELRLMVQNSPEFLINMRGFSQASHNQLYHPRQVTWTWNLDDGLKVSILAVNHDIPTTGGDGSQ